MDEALERKLDHLLKVDFDLARGYTGVVSACRLHGLAIADIQRICEQELPGESQRAAELLVTRAQRAAQDSYCLDDLLASLDADLGPLVLDNIGRLQAEQHLQDLRGSPSSRLVTRGQVCVIIGGPRAVLGYLLQSFGTPTLAQLVSNETIESADLARLFHRPVDPLPGVTTLDLNEWEGKLSAKGVGTSFLDGLPGKLIVASDLTRLVNCRPPLTRGELIAADAVSAVKLLAEWVSASNRIVIAGLPCYADYRAQVTDRISRCALPNVVVIGVD